MMIGGLFFSQILIPEPQKRRLAGKVTVDAKAASKRVVVGKRYTEEYVASTISNSDGTWDIRGMPVMPERSLMATCYDDTGTYNAEILDFLSQVE